MADTLEENFALDDRSDVLSQASDDIDAVSVASGEPESNQDGSDPVKNAVHQHPSKTAGAAEEAERLENKKRKRKEREKARKVKVSNVDVYSDI